MIFISNLTSLKKINLNQITFSDRRLTHEHTRVNTCTDMCSCLYVSVCDIFMYQMYRVLKRVFIL
jgi:hypothetical protein